MCENMRTYIGSFCGTAKRKFLWPIEITANESNRDKNDNATEEKVEVCLCFHGQLYCGDSAPQIKKLSLAKE